MTGWARYTRAGRLGRGGDAEVFAAREPLTDADVALKLLLETGTIDQEPRLLREYQYLRDLDLVGVPRARGLGRDPSGRAYLVMDRCPGTPAGRWAKATREAASTPREAAPVLLATLARAGALVAAVHAAGVVHGDLKPSGFLVADDRVSLVDFGAGRPRDRERLVGRIAESFTTAAYAAVELLERRAATAASDVWSLSAVACRVLLGDPPFGDGTRKEVRARITPAALDGLVLALAERAPRAAVDVIRAGFEADPRSRPDAATWARAFGEARASHRAPPALAPPPGWGDARPVPALAREARTHLQRGDWSAARACIHDPRLARPWALVSLAELELELGHVAVAADAVAALDPDSPDAHLAARRLALALQIGTAHGRVDGLAAAMATFAARPALDPTVVSDLAVALGIAALDGGDLAAARAMVEAAQAQVGGDLDRALAAELLGALVDGAAGSARAPSAATLARAEADGRHGALLRLALAHGDLAAAHARATRMATRLAPSEAMPLGLAPWLVEVAAGSDPRGRP